MRVAPCTDLENAVSAFKTKNVAIGPITKRALFWQAVSTDTESRDDDVAVRWPHVDGLDDFDKSTPLRSENIDHSFKNARIVAR